MKISSIDGQTLGKYVPSDPVIGLDIGSRGSKRVLPTSDEIHTDFVPTGLYMQETADDLLARLLRQSGLRRRDIAFVVGTGYGQFSLKYDDIPYQVVTEITCHAMGAHVLNPRTRTIIDIGGQDPKAIKIDPATGKAVEFVMNDKCAAGTGRFLEKAAVPLGLELHELGPVALEATDPSPVSSQCVVFAESEMISLRARGERVGDTAARANIAAGIHFATARWVKSLLGRIGTEPDLVFNGGAANNAGMWHALETLIGARFAHSPMDMIDAGALGAAVHAGRHHAAALAAGTARRTTRAAARTTPSPARKAAGRVAAGGRKTAAAHS